MNFERNLQRRIPSWWPWWIFCPFRRFPLWSKWIDQRPVLAWNPLINCPQTVCSNKRSADHGNATITFNSPNCSQNNNLHKSTIWAIISFIASIIFSPWNFCSDSNNFWDKIDWIIWIFIARFYSHSSSSQFLRDLVDIIIPSTLTPDSRSLPRSIFSWTLKISWWRFTTINIGFK